MIRVAYLCADPGVPVFGAKGASVHVQEIIRAWQARGAQVTLYCTRTGDLVPADLTGVRVVRVPVDGGDPTLDKQQRTAVREHHQARAASELADRVVADGADIVYERYSLFSTALAEVTRRLGVPGILEVNAPLIEEQRDHRQLVDEPAAAQALQVQVAAAASVCCVSQPVADWVRRRAGIPAGDPRVVVTPNGVNTDRIGPVGPAGDGPATVLFVGTLKPWHGVDVLLRAAALATRPWRLRIVGDGPQAGALDVQADRLGLHVDFRGAVAPERVPAALAGASVAVAPYPALTGSDAQYFSPLKIYEYAAAALPVVASQVGQVPRIVRHGRTGLLVPPSDPCA
ncbi:MAG: glycosyltransferase family 4 protein, partial [Actinomycetota bacterium]|nr:glycosyltransferase family 4 protein [Actinomycetota bacterium]